MLKCRPVVPCHLSKHEGVCADESVEAARSLRIPLAISSDLNERSIASYGELWERHVEEGEEEAEAQGVSRHSV